MKIKLLFIFALLAGFGLPNANASPILTFVTNTQTVALGSSVTVSAVLTGLEDGGLDEIIAAYDLSVSYDDAVLSYAGGTFFGLSSDTFLTSLGGGTISWNSISYDSDAALQSAQGNSFTLATMVFNTLSTGTSALSYSYHDVTGLNAATLNYATLPGSVTVNAVAEPSSLVLMSLAMMLMAGVKQRKALVVLAHGC